MPSVTRKPQRTRADRRNQILQRMLEATEAMLEEGESFTELSVERLVGKAGISRSTFYVYFEDKGDLLRALSGDVMIQLLEAAELWWTAPPDAGRDVIRRSMAEVVRTYVPHATLMAAVVDSAPYDVAVREQFHGLMGRYQTAIAQHIRAGQADGSVQAGLPPEETAALLSWMAERALYQIVRTVEESQLEPFVEALTSIVWNTLYAGVRDEDGTLRR